MESPNQYRTLEGADKDDLSLNGSGPRSKNYYYLILHNIPPEWDYSQVKKLIKTTCNSPSVNQGIRFVNINKPFTSVIFTNFNAAREASQKLKNVEIKGKNLFPVLNNQEQMDERMKKVEDKKGQKHLINNLNNNKKINIVLNKIKMQTEDPQQTGNNISLETYGLNIEFLNKLGITPPLYAKLLVKNLAPKVDESKLYEVFGMAGKVLEVFILKDTDGVSKGVGKITYDHPVEAVQAISMLHGKSLYEMEMQIHMDHQSQRRKWIPPGLKSIGPGLGENGFPLPFVRAHMEIQKLKKLVDDLGNTVNAQLNRNAFIDKNPVADIPGNPLWTLNNAAPMANCNPMGNVQDMLQGLLQLADQNNTRNALQALMASIVNSQGNPAPNSMPNIGNPGPGMWSNQMPNQENWQNKPGNWSGSTNANQPPNMGDQMPDQGNFWPGSTNQPPNMGNQMPDQGNWQANPNPVPKPVGSQMGRGPSNGGSYGNPAQDQEKCVALAITAAEYAQDAMNNRNSQGGNKDSSLCVADTSSSSDMVIFNYLPPSVEIDALNRKMQSIVGPVKFGEMTGRGKAIVRFHNAQHAEKCIDIFDNSKVDGQVIKVRFV